METTTTLDQWCHDTRKAIDAIIQNVGRVKDSRPEKGGRELALVYTKLQEAKMWTGKILEEIGSPFPKALADKAE